MILSIWLSGLTITVIYWGFAAALGHTMFHLRNTKAENVHLLWLAVSGLGLGLQTLALPFQFSLQIAIIFVAFAIFTVFTQRPTVFPVWLWSYRLGMRYISFAMLLAIIWSLTQLHPLLAFSISISALLAGSYSWQRSLEFN